jgi:ClpP class serine protease
MATPPAPPSAPPNDATQAGAKLNTPVFVSVLNECNVNADQLNRRQKLISQIEASLTKRFGIPNRLISYVLRFGHSRTMMSTSDVPSLESILNSVAGASQINLLVHSPGGDGTIAEKMIEMCRSYLTGGSRKLRVIVPNLAKSAATILALGADELLMGHVSELGPIDPQIPIIVSGATQWVSAFAFVEARDRLVEDINKAVKKKESTVALLQQLASLNIPFTNEMENQIGFSKKTAITLLDKYMLQEKYQQPKPRQKKAGEIAEKLLSKQLFPVHGHYISGSTAKQLGLEVEVLDKDDDLWKLIWEYYIRAEVQMNLQLQPPFVKTKLFESSTASLANQDMP